MSFLLRQASASAELTFQNNARCASFSIYEYASYASGLQKCIEVASCGLRCSRGDRRLEVLLVGRILGLRIDSGYPLKNLTLILCI